MPDPADDAGREVVLEAGGLQVTEATLRHRLTVASELAHAQALEAASAATERDNLQWQIDNDVQLKDLRTELAAVTAELDRLRSIPELRIGQRFRQASRSVRRSASEAAADESPTKEDEGNQGQRVEGSPGLGYPALSVPSAVVTVRNRSGALKEVVSTLRDMDIQNLIVVDNASSDPAVAEILAGSGCSVIRLDADLGSDAPWAAGVMARLLSIGNVLDVEGLALPGPGCPADVVDRMVDELRRRPDADAVQLIDDQDASNAKSGFRLLRQGLASRPHSVTFLDAPYEAVAVRSDSSDPSETYARLHDD